MYSGFLWNEEYNKTRIFYYYNHDNVIIIWYGILYIYITIENKNININV